MSDAVQVWVDFSSRPGTVLEVPVPKLPRVTHDLLTRSPTAALARALPWKPAGLLALLGWTLPSAVGAAAGVVTTFHQTIRPMLERYCYDCHGEGMSKGDLAFDELGTDAETVARKEVWLATLKNVRAGLMPLPGHDGPRPDAKEISDLANWIKYGAFGLDPANPDPGRVTARRLNRVEYRNTIRDLAGIDFNSEVEFPPDDSGNGFDNNGDVLTLSPLLLEKYLAAAEAIVERVVPKVSKVVRETTATGRDFRPESGPGNGEQLSAKQAAIVSKTFQVDKDDTYQLAIELEAKGTFDFDPGHCTVIGRVDGEQRFADDVVWKDRLVLKHDYELSWSAGTHTISFEVVPLSLVEGVTPRMAAMAGAVTGPPPAARGGNIRIPPPGAEKSAAPARPPAATRLDVRVVSVQVRGPMSPKHWEAPKNYDRFFPRAEAPAAGAERDRYAAEVLRRFATKAYRRPVAEEKVTQLVAIARGVYAKGQSTFEEGIGRAVMAVLASPRFLFRVEETDPREAQKSFAAVDDYALASRLSYFLWSTMPDAELFGLAERGALRAALPAQVARMLKEEKAQAFVRSFTGQWLQARDVEFVPINARVVNGANARPNKDGRIEFDGPLRKLMRSETEMYFDHVLREDRSVLELIESDYTYLNERLAAQYGVPDVTGDEIRLVKLPPDSIRGGVLTQGTVLTVTSNPTRTSPVKRGLFILDNILGTPPPPPPPDVPALEEAKTDITGREPKLSEMLAVHRANKLCSSCHERMDPLGLAFENFNALGIWRDLDAKQPIDASGRLITGEAFASVRELKHVLVTERRMDFYRCLTEKMLTYALGRGLEYYDTHSVDVIVERLAREDGRMSALIMGVIESAPFQKQRNQRAVTADFPSPATSASFTQTKPTP